MGFTETVCWEGMPGLVPPEALQILLMQGRAIRVQSFGYRMWPCVSHGALLAVEACGPSLHAGDLVLVDFGGNLRLRRLISLDRPSGCIVATDTSPTRTAVPRSACVARVAGGGNGVPFSTAFHSIAARCLSPLAEMAEVAAESNRQESLRPAGTWKKYEDQAVSFAEAGFEDLSELVESELASLPRGARVLVLGCGTGGEMSTLGRLGCDTVGVDFSHAMLREAKRRLAGHDGHQLCCMDLSALGFRDVRFDAVLFTASVYAMVPGRRSRRALLRELRDLLRPQGRLFLSARFFKNWRERILAALYFLLRGSEDAGGAEHGDWFTTFVQPDGSRGSSYIRLSGDREIRSDLRGAGFRFERRVGTEYLAVAPPDQNETVC